MYYLVCLISTKKKCNQSDQLPGNQQRLREVTALDQEIVRHTILYKMVICGIKKPLHRTVSPLFQSLC